jgi:hypothetical protein
VESRRADSNRFPAHYEKESAGFGMLVVVAKSLR